MKLPLIDAKATGELLKQRRLAGNFTVTEIAEMLGVTQQAVSKWEKGINLPKLENAVMLSALYCCKVDDLIATCI